MRRALARRGVRSPPSAPGGGGAASAALSAPGAQRGSTTFVAASLHRALTLGASSGEGSGRDNNTPPPPAPPRRRRPPVVAATPRGRLGSGLGLTTSPGLRPRALLRPAGTGAGAGRGGGDRAAAHGWGGKSSGAVPFLLSPPTPRGSSGCAAADPDSLLPFPLRSSSGGGLRDLVVGP
ncbi:uncharacterized protein Cdk13-dt [Urocitellus parryii]